jgi:hypothetical protein
MRGGLIAMLVVPSASFVAGWVAVHCEWSEFRAHCSAGTARYVER